MSHRFDKKQSRAGLGSRILRSGAAAFVAAFYLFPIGRVSASVEFGSRVELAQDATQQNEEPGTTARIRVAEGEYKALTEDGIGPSDPAVYNFDESWTLWRLRDGSFEVNGTRSYRSPSDEPHSNQFSAHLSADRAVLELMEFRKLRWRTDSGPLDCKFLPAKISCTSNARDVTQNVSLDVPIQAPAGLMWPMSTFSLSSIARSASHDQKTLTPVQLVTLEDGSREDPIFTTIFAGHLKYLGQEQLSLAGRKWYADKFELKVAAHPPFLAWTSPEGLLLAFAPENKNKTLAHDGIELVRFQQSNDF
jgi:hypothetical protein